MTRTALIVNAGLAATFLPAIYLASRGGPLFWTALTTAILVPSALARFSRHRTVMDQMREDTSLNTQQHPSTTGISR